ncbi:MAG: hypothetical protein AAF747_08265 [Planctomycetota bacterium]
MKTATPAQTLLTLTDGLIDYAGLFPPAKLGMHEAATNYTRYLMGVERKMLGRFICTASRLEELTEHASILMPGDAGTSGYREMADVSEPWRISVVADLPLTECLDAIDAFNKRHSDDANGQAKADAIELKADSAEAIDDALEELPEDILPYFELPIDRDVRGLVAALAGDNARAKIRCGGVTPDAIPPAEQVAAFIHACALGGVAFKATAGLHHPVRAEWPLTYENDAPKATMHGFVNVFIAAAMVHRSSLDLERTIEVLHEEDAAAFSFESDRVVWSPKSGDAVEVSLIDLSSSREKLATSYGSCSFAEPIRDLKQLGWL